MKSSNIGGQAVLEGIMMKNQDQYAVAVRKPDGEIEVSKGIYHSVVGRRICLLRIPFVRGVFQFVDSLVLGVKTMTYSADFYEDEERATPVKEEEKRKQERQEKWMIRGTVFFFRSPEAGDPLLQRQAVCGGGREDRNFPSLHFFDFQGKRYTEDVYVSRGGA